jgi:hypothetical protein
MRIDATPWTQDVAKPWMLKSDKAVPHLLTRSRRTSPWHAVTTFNISTVEHVLGPGRRVYSNAGAEVISGVDILWSRLRKVYGATRLQRPSASAQRQPFGKLLFHVLLLV